MTPHALHAPYAEVIGDPVAQSRSPLIHRFWFERSGLDGDYRATRVAAGDLGGYFARRGADPSWRGCNVTVPHKQAVQPFLDGLDPAAVAADAVNTVYRRADGALVGTNTDMTGFLEPLRPLLARRHLFRMARLVGTGGAASAIARALAAEGFVLVIFGRDLARAQALAARHGADHHAAPLASLAEPTDFAFDDRVGCLDLVVNASSLGMTGQPPLVLDWSHVPPGSVVVDIVYAPLETALLAGARARRFLALDGLHMLVGQAAAAFERFFGVPAPRDHDGALRALLTA